MGSLDMAKNQTTKNISQFFKLKFVLLNCLPARAATAAARSGSKGPIRPAAAPSPRPGTRRFPLAGAPASWPATQIDVC